MSGVAEPARQAIAGLIAACAFLALYFGASMVAWAAAAAGLVVYAATLLIVPRRPPPERRMIAEDVSEADHRAALAALETAAERLRAADPRAPAADRGVLGDLARVLDRIRAHHAADPRDLRHTRRFLRHDLPRLVETSETYVALAERSGDGQTDRLAELGARIRGFKAPLERLERACLENDFSRLEVETEVLSEQLGRR